MADVRVLLKKERIARRVQHKHASYSTTGTLLCTVCHLQLKSESLWDGHLRSAGHIMRAQKQQEDREEDEAHAAKPHNGNGSANSKKRKASDEEDQDTTHKRTKPAESSLPEGLFDAGSEDSTSSSTVKPSPTSEIHMKIPSRPATPLKTPQEIPKRPDVDEDEWAAFEADVAAADVEGKAAANNDGAVISAPPISTAELKQKEAEEDNQRRRERLEAEAEGDKEDAARKLEEEFEEMEDLEGRVKRLREKREALRRRGAAPIASNPPAVQQNQPVELEVEAEEEDDDEDDDDWDSFRIKA